MRSWLTRPPNPVVQEGKQNRRVLMRLVGSLFVVFSFSCAPRLTTSERAEQLARSLVAINPDAEPAPPLDAPTDARLAFNTEYWLGTEADEATLFEKFGAQIQELQKATAESRAQPVSRGFHAKSHGCLKGELRLDPHRDARTRFGAFAAAYTTWPVIVRYSNGVGWTQPDDELDARGMAVKLLGVPGRKYVGDGDEQDFLMTNSPTPVGRDAIEFMEFAKANAKGRLAGIGFLLGHLRSGNALFRTGAIASTVNETYWSGGPLHLGAHQAVKVSATPCPDQATRAPRRDDPNYLAADLAEAAQTGVCATMRVQFQQDPITMPIEDSSIVWDEEVSPPVPVGTITLPPQQPMPREACDALVFHPWHAVAAHKPMGNHNRARRIVYSASQQRRGASSAPTKAAP